jgi:hypothetical protein
MNIAEKAYELGIRKATIGFSTGKDSVVGLDMLIKAGIQPYPIFFYQVPNLEFIENNLKMYEDYFKVKIARMPHPILYDHLRHQDWQPYIETLTIGQIKFDKLTFDHATKVWLRNSNITDVEYDCNCMKMADSLNRRLTLSKKPDIDHDKKTIYLTKYFTKTEIFDYIKRNNIPLTKDYEIFGISWDGLAYHFSCGVKKYYPNDWEKIKEYFPLIDAEIFRYKLVKKYKDE